MKAKGMVSARLEKAKGKERHDAAASLPNRRASSPNTDEKPSAAYRARFARIRRWWSSSSLEAADNGCAASWSARQRSRISGRNASPAGAEGSLSGGERASARAVRAPDPGRKPTSGSSGHTSSSPSRSGAEAYAIDACRFSNSVSSRKRW